MKRWSVLLILDVFAGAYLWIAYQSTENTFIPNIAGAFIGLAGAISLQKLVEGVSEGNQLKNLFVLIMSEILGFLESLDVQNKENVLVSFRCGIWKSAKTTGRIRNFSTKTQTVLIVLHRYVEFYNELVRDYKRKHKILNFDVEHLKHESKVIRHVQNELREILTSIIADMAGNGAWDPMKNYTKDWKQCASCGAKNPVFLVKCHKCKRGLADFDLGEVIVELADRMATK
ncbi:MAG: hypothetical protein ACFFER_08480 [Candidatus Thorarchaeota archaeon]